MSLRIQNAKQLAALHPRLQEAIRSHLPEDDPLLAVPEQKRGRGRNEVVEIPRSVYDPKMEALLQLRLDEAAAALDAGNTKLARELVADAMSGLRDHGPIDALKPWFVILERIRKAWKAAFFSWGDPK